MNLKDCALYFASMFAVVLIVSLIVGYLYGLIVHGSGLLEWETAFRNAIILGIVLTWMHHREKTKSGA